MAKGRSLTQKRKDTDQRNPAKCAKLDVNESAPVLPASSPKKVAGIIKLNGPLPKVPADAYINPVVKDLFLQVNVCIEPSSYI